ncbi:hypothetical protein BH11MYX2_BH11MYX2_39120 [soil metagenome]
MAGGDEWRTAAMQRAVPVETFSIGPAGCDAQDIYGDWYLTSEIEEDGCIVVRPDKHVGSRADAAGRSAHCARRRVRDTARYRGVIANSAMIAPAAASSKP